MAEIKVPSLGESVTEATVAQWLKKEGEAVEADEPIVELETDKVTLEVNAPEGGVIAKISADEGSNVEVGDIIGEIGEGQAANDSGKEKDKKEDKEKGKAKEQKEPEKKEAKEEGKKEDKKEDSEEKLSPAVRKMIEENDLDASDIEGTGKGGRILKEDVQNYLEEQDGGAEEKEAQKATPPREPDTHPVAAATSESRRPEKREERVRMTRLRQSIARRLKEAQDTAAMLTTFNEADMGAVMELRKDYKESFEKKHGVKLGFMSFFVKACVNALREFPAVNAEIDGTDVVYKNYYDIGVAVSTPQGLIVPVVRDCEHKSMAQIEKEIGDLGLRARDGKIGMEELQGGTFTITNGGIFGSLNSTPILNPPQSGILGMHKIQQRPMVMEDGSVQARPMMYLALSYDHRIVDGKEAVSFLVKVKDAIEDPQRLILEV